MALEVIVRERTESIRTVTNSHFKTTLQLRIERNVELIPYQIFTCHWFFRNRPVSNIYSPVGTGPQSFSSGWVGTNMR